MRKVPSIPSISGYVEPPGASLSTDYNWWWHLYLEHTEQES